MVETQKSAVASLGASHISCAYRYYAKRMKQETPQLRSYVDGRGAVGEEIGSPVAAELAPRWFASREGD